MNRMFTLPWAVRGRLFSKVIYTITGKVMCVRVQRLRRVSGVFLLTLWMTACASSASAPPMPELAELKPAGPSVKRLEIRSSESHFQLTAVLLHDHEHLQLAILSPLGQRLFTLLNDGNGARYLPNSTVSPPVTAPWLASRLGWALWSEASLRSVFAGTPWELHTVGSRRDITFDQRIQASVLLSGPCTLIEDFQLKLRMSISPLDTDRSCPPA